MGGVLIGWAVLLAASPDAAAVSAPEGPDAGHFDFAAVPLFNYSSDTGVGFGLRGIVQRRAPGQEPYQLSIELQAYGSTGGVQEHFLSVDLPRLGSSAYRLDLLAGYYRDVAAPYYGIGNHRVPSAALPDAYYAYDEETPLARLRLRRALWSHLSAAAGYRLLLSTIRYQPGSLLASQMPHGVEGGRYAELSLGLVWDTRDHELAPRHGVLLEATVRSSQPFLGSSSASYGAFASGAVYIGLGARWVLAGRAAMDASWGDVPFDRLQDFGSLTTPFYLLSGVGGALSVRGLFQSEYVGPTKAFANLELRDPFWTLHLWGRAIEWTAVAFVDAGRVWAPGDPANLPAGGVVAGAGGGLRMGWGETFLLRADAAYSEGRVRIYADFRHIF